MKLSRRGFLFGAAAAPIAAKAAAEVANEPVYKHTQVAMGFTVDGDADPAPIEARDNLGAHQRYTGYDCLNVSLEDMGIDKEPHPFWHSK